MRGLIVVNNRNEVVIAKGDECFGEYLQDRMSKEIGNDNTDTASTSSGVFSDASEESAPVSRKQTSLYDAPVLAKLREVTHLFLPLISIYRATTGLNDGFETVSSVSCRIQFHSLQSGYLLITISECDTRWDQTWARIVSSTLLLNFGPLLEGCDTDLSVFDGAKANVDRTICHLSKNINSFITRQLDIRAVSFYREQTTRMLPSLQVICDNLQFRLGANRSDAFLSCLLMNNGNILSTITPSLEHLKGNSKLTSEDMCAVQQHFKSLSNGTTEDVTQFWIRKNSTSMYVDAVRCRISEQLDVIVITEAANSRVIRMAAIVTEKLQQLLYDSVDICDADNAINALVDMLPNEVKPQFSTTLSAYMRNPKKSADFIQTVWQRVVSEHMSIEFSSGVSTPVSRRSFSRRFSMATLKSTWSIISMSNSMQTCTGRTKYLPVKMENMIRYVLRQVQSLLRELCQNAQQEARTKKMDVIQATVMGPHKIATTPFVQSLRFSNSDFSNYLRPTSLRFDMLAYTFTAEKLDFTMNYVPDNFSTIFEAYKIEGVERASSMDITFGGKSYFLLKIRYPSIPTHKGLRWFQKWSTKEVTDTPSGCVITVLYHTFVHRQLATKQTNHLAAQLCKLANNCSVLVQ